MGKIARRAFLVGTGVVAGGLAVGFYALTRPHHNPLLDDLDAGAGAFNPYVMIDRGGAVTVIAPRAEMGQGVQTTLAALVAEELGLPLSSLKVEHGPASGAYHNEVLMADNTPFASYSHSFAAETMRSASAFAGRTFGLQVTGASASLRDAYDKMRHAGAVARHLLFAAAADELDVPVDGLSLAGRQIVAPDGRHVGIGEIAEKAASMRPPENIVLKDPKDWTILGKPQQRVDLRAKVTGAPIYGIDVDLPDMLYGTVRMSPRLGGVVKSADLTAADSMPGVYKIVHLDTPTGKGFGVIARNTWTAFKAAEAIDVEWGDAPYPADSNAMRATLRAALDDDATGSSYRDDGDTGTAFSRAGEDATIAAEYEVPFMAHATMEPMNATAQFADGKLTLWAPNQSPTLMQLACASAAGIDSDDVTVHTTYLGGGFGRRSEGDFAAYATRLAMEADGRPVKVTWTREEDMAHDAYRPAARGRFRARIDDEGMPDALEMRIATPSIMKSLGKRLFPSIPVGGPERLLTEGAFDQPYTIPNYRVASIETDMSVPVGYWRSVGYSFNSFFHECFLDEIAIEGGLDPVDMRIRLMGDHPRAVAVMEKLAAMSDWGSKPGPGKARGVAFTLCYETWIGQVVQVGRSPSGLRIEKVWAAADVGRALDPDIVRSQIMGGVVFGLSAALGQEITFEDGMVVQQNFYDYDCMRINQCPEFEIALIEGSEAIGGVGEIGVPGAAPALANAIFALTGNRIRRMPLSREVDFA